MTLGKLLLLEEINKKRYRNPVFSKRYWNLKNNLPLDLLAGEDMIHYEWRQREYIASIGGPTSNIKSTLDVYALAYSIDY